MVATQCADDRCIFFVFVEETLYLLKILSCSRTVSSEEK